MGEEVLWVRLGFEDMIVVTICGCGVQHWVKMVWALDGEPRPSFSFFLSFSKKGGVGSFLLLGCISCMVLVNDIDFSLC